MAETLLVYQKPVVANDGTSYEARACSTTMTGLSQVYLECALRRALETPPTVVVAPPQPSMFSGPAPRPAATEATAESVLDPFAVYEKGEALLRRQLGALAASHLVNMITADELSDEPIAALNRQSAPELIETIVAAVRADRRIVSRRR